MFHEKYTKMTKQKKFLLDTSYLSVNIKQNKPGNDSQQEVKSFGVVVTVATNTKNSVSEF